MFVTMSVSVVIKNGIVTFLWFLFVRITSGFSVVHLVFVFVFYSATEH